jgi:hypothetical protein
MFGTHPSVRIDTWFAIASILPTFLWEAFAAKVFMVHLLTTCESACPERFHPVSLQLV